MEAFGQFGPIVIHPRKQVTGTFKLNKLQNLNKIERPCESNPSYSYRNCLMELAEKISNCSIEVFTNRFNCSLTGLDSLIATLTSLRGSAENDVVFNTGCVPKCQNLQYKFNLKDEIDVTWRKDWVSSFYLSTDSTSYQISTEYYSYDQQVSGLSTKLIQTLQSNDTRAGPNWISGRLLGTISRMVCNVLNYFCPVMVQTTLVKIMH